MKSFKDPSFEQRVGQAADARKKALEQLRAKPPLDQEQVAARVAANAQKEAARAEKAAAKKQAAADEAAAAAVAAAAMPVQLTEAEKKARRDARYAARKNRK